MSGSHLSLLGGPFGNDRYVYAFGANSRLVAPANSFYLIEGLFTIEAWVKFTNIGGGFQAVYSQRGVIDGNSRWFQIGWNSTPAINFPNGSWMIFVSSALLNDSNGLRFGGTVPTANQWINFSFVRFGTTSCKLFVNGVWDGRSGFVSGNVGFNNAAPGIAADNLGNFQLSANSQIASLRISKEALYLFDYTPTTGPLSALSSTILLTCQSPSIQDQSQYTQTLTVTGTVTPTVDNAVGQ
jgi:hypothetical protein